MLGQCLCLNYELKVRCLPHIRGIAQRSVGPDRLLCPILIRKSAGKLFMSAIVTFGHQFTIWTHRQTIENIFRTTESAHPPSAITSSCWIPRRVWLAVVYCCHWWYRCQFSSLGLSFGTWGANCKKWFSAGEIFTRCDHWCESNSSKTSAKIKLK